MKQMERKLNRQKSVKYNVEEHEYFVPTEIHVGW